MLRKNTKGFFLHQLQWTRFAMARALSLRQEVPEFTVVTYSPTSGLLQVKNENREEVFLREVILPLVLIHIPWRRD